ncbi:MAG: amino acid racemase [Candidatus Micrarchaeota archaeon]
MSAIGILGGMGPESTAYTYMEMVRYCQRRFGAKLDSDFPPIIIYSMPVPDVVVEGSDDEELLALLDNGIARLESAGASFSLIACNTMQGFVPALRKKYRMLSLVEETVAQARSGGIKRWGVLGTEVTLRKGYYQEALRQAGLEPVVPERPVQGEITLAIREILSGSGIESPKKRLLGAMEALGGLGAQGMVLACTDLPLAVSQQDASFALLDTAAISARAAVEKWKSEV